MNDENQKYNLEFFFENNKQKFGLKPYTKKALLEYGIIDIRMIEVLSEQELLAIPTLTEDILHKIFNAMKETFHMDENSFSIKTPRYQKIYLSTGVSTIDQLLGGGLPSGSIIELYGEYRTGKTQFCLTCAAAALSQLNNSDSPKKVLYIDSSNAFHASHFSNISHSFDLTREQALGNLILVQAESIRLLVAAIDQLPILLSKYPITLVIIDSLFIPFMREHQYLNQWLPFLHKMIFLLGKLKRLAIAFNIPILLTNQVTENFGPFSQYNPISPWGGPELAHHFDLRLSLKKSYKEGRRMKVEACAWLPNEVEHFYLTADGVCENEDGRKIIDREEINFDFQDDPVYSSPIIEGVNEVATSLARAALKKNNR